MDVQGRTAGAGITVAGITVAALAVVGVLGFLAARSEPGNTASTTAGTGLPPNPWAQRKPATSATLPTGTGTGPRVVYALGIHRLWVVGTTGQVLRTYRVPATQPYLPAGIYTVYTRRATEIMSTEPTGTEARVAGTRSTEASQGRKTQLRYVLLMEQGKSGGSRFGFCSIPLTGSGMPATPPVQAGGEASVTSCVQQKPADARYLWKAAPVGTRIVVVP